MASALEPEIQLAQKLASNERPIRTRAIKKLRKYIILRSQKETGRFTGDELLKLWKGLFYCLWMQDKPLLQEELSNQIAHLIHSFHYIDGQFLYLESSLQTFKREWTNIDRLRMDKFFQLVRFMFRQTFEMLKRKNWESSLVGRFLELLTAQVLQSGSAAPSGLQFHILDIYLTELARVGSAELTANQNLMLIEPFCKIAAKTKDRTLFSVVCNSIFSTIIDQAPFAIEELIKEVKAAEDSDSGQASGEDCEDQIKERKPIPPKKKQTGNKLNDSKSPEEEEGDEDEDEEDEDELHLKDLDTELPCDGDIGPVLQFDYAALADKLFQFARRRSTPSKNRERLYKITKVLWNLNEGNFPHDNTEEVSTDEDDDMFGSRKRIKRRFCHVDQDEEGSPATTRKGKKNEASTLNKQNQHTEKDDSEQVDLTATNGKKKKRKKKARNGATAVCSKQAQAVDQEVSAEAEITSETCWASCEETTTTTQESVAAVPVKKKKGRKATTKPEGGEDEQKIHGVSSEGDSMLIHCDDSADDTICLKKQTNSSTPAKKKKKKKKKNLDADAQVELERNPTEITSEASQNTTAVAIKKKTKKRNRKKLQQTLAASPVADDSAVTLLKNNKSHKELETAVKEKDAVAATQVVNTEKLPLQIPVTPPAKKKKKKTPKLAPVQTEGINDESPLQMVSSLKVEPPVNKCEALSSSGNLTKKKKRKIPVVFEFEADEVEVSAQKDPLIKDLATEETASKKTKLVNDAEESATPASVKKSASRLTSDFVTFQSNTVVPTPLFCKTKTSPSTPLSSKKIKKRRSPKSESKKVTFGLRNNKTAEFRKTDRSLLVSPDGSSRVPFDPKQKPKFGVLKSPPTTASTIKLTPHPKRKTSLKSPKCTPKRRPLAADFF